jgi:hypothetical protein
MTCTDAQVRQIMKERTQGKTQQQAALKANVKSTKTVRKYEKSGKLPSEQKKARQWRTRTDAFAEDWPQIEQMLTALPGLEVKALFDWLCEQHPERYQAGQVRTLQRRVNDWRALNREQTASLAQVHQPGDLMEVDGTWLTELDVTIAGEAFHHILIHCVLSYSNWEWGCLAQSESVLALRGGIQRTLHKLGYVPHRCQTDNSTAATYLLKSKTQPLAEQRRPYHPLYQELMSYYGMEPCVTHVRAPDENGDIEAANGGVKRAIKQQLLLRGSRDFPTVEAYAHFVDEVMERRNRAKLERLAEECAAMRPLAKPPLAAYRERRIKVSAGSLIRIQTNTYSVPTSLIGYEVVVHQHEWHLEVYYQQKLVQTMPRLVGRFQEDINYRHLVGTLLRKPGGFRNYRYQQALFPLPVFRQTWDQLNVWYSERKADLVYLRILNLAAKHLECEVAAACTLLLEQGERFDDSHLEKLMVGPSRPTAIMSIPVQVDLRRYDALLSGGARC